MATVHFATMPCEINTAYGIKRKPKFELRFNNVQYIFMKVVYVFVMKPVS